MASMFRRYYGIPKDTSWHGFMERFPILFYNKDKSMKETCMCWGIECPYGWFYILEQLCTILEFHNNKFAKDYGLAIVADQVKEKFGTLRFYFTVRNVTVKNLPDNTTFVMLDPEIPTPTSEREIAMAYLEMLAEKYIDEAEDLTANTCQDCGIPLDKDNKVQTKGWVSYVCKECNEKREKKRAEYIEQLQDKKGTDNAKNCEVKQEASGDSPQSGN